MIKIGDYTVAPTIFPDGTSQVWKLPENILKQEYVTVTWEFENEAEFIHLAQLKTLLDTYHVMAYLDLPYLPYARQDKIVSNETTFALQAFGTILNSLNFERVKAIDTHNSYVASRILSCFSNVSVDSDINGIIDAIKPDLIVFPDEGASLRYSVPKCNSNLPFLCATKVRDPSTGQITSIKLPFNDNTPYSLKFQEVLIVDDLCDGGATFVELAGLLKGREALAVHLYVTHGLFTKGTQILRDAGIQRIFTRKGEIK